MNSMKNAVFYTLGCKANQYQTEILKSELGAADSRLAAFGERADLYVINTCTVTEDADRKSRQAIRRALRLCQKVIVTGCYAKLNKDYLIKTFPEAVIIDFPNHLSTHQPNHLSSRVRVNLMIQDGCQHFCSYCIVPYARGKNRSKPVKEVINEAERLVDAGAREIVLTGINLGTYQYNLPAVIKSLSGIRELLRIRLSSIEPMYLSRELIDCMAETPKVCHHLHVPLQSGDNKILKSMNRNYTGEDFLELINYIRSQIPDCGITTDIIVGFPGEGEEEFKNTVDLVDRIKFSRLHIFPYSKRSGTPAAELPGQVDVKNKKVRSEILQELRNKHMVEFANQYLGKEVEILVEQKGEGLASNYIRCFFNDASDLSGTLKNIFVQSVNNLGEIRD